MMKNGDFCDFLEIAVSCIKGNNARMRTCKYLCAICVQKHAKRTQTHTCRVFPRDRDVYAGENHQKTAKNREIAQSRTRCLQPDETTRSSKSDIPWHSHLYRSEMEVAGLPFW